ncbi:MAG TPA: HAD family hydrolase [Acidimicrobiia bacterium]|nr:HAD family hydrolase [Acidimicrobiia bacterium]
MAPLVVGFDLDLTLVDPRPGVRAAFDALIAETGAPIDVDTVLGRLGPLLEIELASWVPADRVDDLAARYRAFYREVGVPGTELLPGARDAIAAVHARGGHTLVVTAKEDRNARACIEHVGIDVDVVLGLRYGDGKVDALREYAATIYVGDTTTDIESGRAAGCTTVGVASGPHSQAQLKSAGADIVLDSLRDFPAWLETAPSR